MTPYNEHDWVEGPLSIGRGTYWTPGEFTIEAYHGRIRVGRYCSFARRTVIIAGGEHRLDGPATWNINWYGAERHPLREIGDTVIGHDVWTGDGAFIGHAAHVGNGAVIGAGAVVVKDVPAYAIVVGNPARLVRFRHPTPICEALERIAWWNWTPETLRNRVMDFNLSVEDFIAKHGP